MTHIARASMYDSWCKGCYVPCQHGARPTPTSEEPGTTLPCVTSTASGGRFLAWSRRQRLEPRQGIDREMLAENEETTMETEIQRLAHETHLRVRSKTRLPRSGILPGQGHRLQTAVRPLATLACIPRKVIQSTPITHASGGIISLPL